MTTYTYNPLYGITSVTDPNNVTTFYEYDSFGRLQIVKDHNKHALSTNTYHYYKQ
jgi:YD repeat-containing protein